jgi:hypothetical protein
MGIPAISRLVGLAFAAVLTGVAVALFPDSMLQAQMLKIAGDLVFKVPFWLFLFVVLAAILALPAETLLDLVRYFLKKVPLVGPLLDRLAGWLARCNMSRPLGLSNNR